MAIRNAARLALIGLNVLLRAQLAYFLWEVVTQSSDPRFAGKAIPLRNLVIVGGMSLVFPLVRRFTRRWARYPWAADDLYLSVFWLDMAGNSFDLYDRYLHFDLIPHLHGTGSFALLFEGAFGMSRARAIVLANALHGALEAQEILTDVFFGTHNVRGAWDSVLDMVVGAAGTLLYPLLWRRTGPAKSEPPARPPSG